MGVKISMLPTNQIVNSHINNNDVGYFMAETCARYMDGFIPMDTGMLAQNYVTEPFAVTYNQPYAEKIFNGDGFNFNREKHPNATAHWDVATSSAYGTQIAKEVSDYINSR